MIIAQDINFKYVTDIEFHINFSFQIQRGEFVFILGDSGSGKSTILSLLAGFLRPTHGRIIINGSDATEFPPHKREIAMAFQEHNLFNHLSVLTNFILAHNKGRLAASPQQMAEIYSIVDQMGLNGLENRLPTELSGGQLQRASLGRSLAQNKSILLLDEPFSSLDPTVRAELLEIYFSLSQKKRFTTLMITHNPSEAKKYATKILFVHKGTVSPVMSKDSFFNSKSPEIKRYLSTDFSMKNRA